MKLITLPLTFLLFVILNCRSMPPTSNLRIPEKQKKKIAKTIIIDRTTIPVLEGEERKDIEDELLSLIHISEPTRPY